MRTFFDILRDNRGFAGGGDDEDDDEQDDTLDDDITDDDETGDDEGLEIDLDEEDDDEAPPSSKKAWAAMRVENKELKKTVEDLKKSVDSLTAASHDSDDDYVPPVATDPGKFDQNNPRTWSEKDWDELAKRDWKKAVDLRSQIQAEDRIAASQNTSEFNRVLETSKQEVLRRHPELNDPNSEKSKIYRNIVVANPEYTNQRKGPLSAMYEMEDYLEKNMGWKREDIVKAEARARQDEADRHSRVQLTSTAGRNISEGNKIVISKDELEFCKLQGIDPKTYAANKKRLERAGKGGVQL